MVMGRYNVVKDVAEVETNMHIEQSEIQRKDYFSVQYIVPQRQKR